MKTVGIIGAGTMGRGIAQVAAMNGHNVVLVDLSQETIEAAMASYKKISARQVEKGRWTEEFCNEWMGKISTSNDSSSLKDANLIIEAIVENIDVKKSVFSNLESIVSDDCILATNTSSLSVSAIAQCLEKPERCVGLHFFNPAPLMKLVEIVPAIQTDTDVVSKCQSLMADWSKIGVLAKDTPGFIVNRVARPFYSEAIRIYEEGIATVAQIDTIVKNAGYRMGPFELMDYIGHDVNYKVTCSVWQAFYYDERYKPSHTQKQLSDAGYLGRKSGKGFYTYPKSDDVVELPNADIQKQIIDRIQVMLINEAADALFKQVATAKDIELAMTKGVNYPQGLLSLANAYGLEFCRDLLDKLYDRYRDGRYRCSPMIRDLAAANAKFDI